MPMPISTNTQVNCYFNESILLLEGTCVGVGGTKACLEIIHMLKKRGGDSVTYLTPFMI
jgi:hypothetical protein